MIALVKLAKTKIFKCKILYRVINPLSIVTRELNQMKLVRISEKLQILDQQLLHSKPTTKNSEATRTVSTHHQILSVDRIRKTYHMQSLPLDMDGTMREPTSFSRTHMDRIGVSKDLARLILQSVELPSGLIKLSIDM